MYVSILQKKVRKVTSFLESLHHCKESGKVTKILIIRLEGQSGHTPTHTYADMFIKLENFCKWINRQNKQLQLRRI